MLAQDVQRDVSASLRIGAGDAVGTIGAVPHAVLRHSLLRDDAALRRLWSPRPAESDRSSYRAKAVWGP